MYTIPPSSDAGRIRTGGKRRGVLVGELRLRRRNCDGGQRMRVALQSRSIALPGFKAESVVILIPSAS